MACGAVTIELRRCGDAARA
jgi:hypothetical protein